MKQARIHIKWDFYINDSYENSEYHYNYAFKERGENPDHMTDGEKYNFLMKYFGLIEFINIPEENSYNLHDPVNVKFIVDNYLVNQCKNYGFIVKSLKRIEESKDFFRVYLTFKRANVFDDGPYEFETFYYPNLSVEEVKTLFSNLNDEYQMQHELNILKSNLWVWSKDSLTSILSKHLEIIDNSSNQLVSPKEWFLKYGAII